MSLCWYDVTPWLGMIFNWLQGLPILLAVMGAKLQCLQVDGWTGLLADFNFSFLWTVPNLQRLSLLNLPYYLKEKEFERGIACLR